MNKENLGQEPAFPSHASHQRDDIYYGNYQVVNEVISKRFYAACAAMQGMLSGVLSNLEMYKVVNDNAKQKGFDNLTEYIIKESYYAADELLKQENKQIEKNLEKQL